VLFPNYTHPSCDLQTEQMSKQAAWIDQIVCPKGCWPMARTIDTVELNQNFFQSSIGYYLMENHTLM